MDDELNYIPNKDKHDYPFCRLKILTRTFLDTTSFELTYHYTVKTSFGVNE